MPKKKDKLYCVTAMNRLTLDRDIVTPPCSYDKAKQVIEKFRSESNEHSSYMLSRIDVYKP